MDHAFAVWLDPRQKIQTADLGVSDRPKVPSFSKARNDEIVDLRTPSYNIAHAVPCSYGSSSVSNQTGKGNQNLRNHDERRRTRKISGSLPTRTQSRFISAAYTGFKNGYALNAILTVNWAKLCESTKTSWLNSHPYDRAKLLVERIRKFLTRAKRRCPVAYIWVREVASEAGEHLHLALHLPSQHRKDFISFLGRLLGQPNAKHQRPPKERTKGEVACSLGGEWHLGVEVREASPEFPGYWLAAYLAKAEPSQRAFRGNVVDNTLKKERGRAFGGRIKGEKYDSPQGIIVGNSNRKGRYSISKSIMP